MRSVEFTKFLMFLISNTPVLFIHELSVERTRAVLQLRRLCNAALDRDSNSIQEQRLNWVLALKLCKDMLNIGVYHYFSYILFFL